MPYKKTRKVRKTKRTFRRKVRRSYKKKSKGKGTIPTLFPSKFFCKFKYADQQQLTCTLGALANYTYRLNSLYDPDLTSGGQQPRYFDSLVGNDGSTQPYQNYRVHGCRVKVQFINTGSSSGSVGYVVIRARSPVVSSWGAADTADDFATQPWTKYKIIHVNGNDNCIRTMSMYVPIKKLAGFKDLDDVSFQGDFSSNPGLPMLLDVSYVPIDLATTASVRFSINLEYLTELFTINQVQDS